MANHLIPKTGFWRNESIPTKANQAYAVNEAIYNDGTNDVPATTGTKVTRGITREAKASAANTNDIVIAVPTSPDCTFQATATGTLTAAMVGTDMDFATSTTIAQGTSTNKPVKLIKFIDANTGEFAFNYAMGLNAA
jgi:hypothetical protein